MNPLTKMALGLMGQLRPEPSTGDGSPVLALPAPRQGGGMPLMQALARLRGEKRDGAGRGGRGERLPVGRPGEVDGVVVELRGPVFGQLHATGGIRSGRI